MNRGFRMTSTTPAGRLLRRSAALAGALTLCAAATAYADITGTVTTPGGTPLPGVSVRAVETAGGGLVDSTTTNANGQFTITVNPSFDTAPFTLEATLFDSCKPSGQSSLAASAASLPDGAVQNLALDAALFCEAFTPFNAPEPTGNVWPERGQVLSGPGGVTYIRVLAASAPAGYALTLQDGTNVGGGTDRTALTLTAPATPYTGPLNLSYTDSDGIAVSRQVATLVSGNVVNPAPPAGPSDLAAIVDISGSMSGADPSFRRKDAVQLLVDLSNQGDRLVGTAFDDEFTEIFPRTTIAGEASKGPLKRLARQRIVNDGGTDYDVGMAAAFDALAADPLNPLTPKAAIFLTDGAHNGTYDNSHLRFAFNGTGRSWPICVVQLGSGFAASDTARLKRIARETGGIYSATPNNTQLENLYFQCRGRSSGATTLLKRTATYRIGQTRAYARRIAKKQRRATFFVSWGVGRYRIQAVQPGGKVYTRSLGKRVRLVRGKTFQFFQIQNPKAGLWRLRVTRLATGAPTDTATTTVTVQKRR
jgi:hypothetical protein